MKPRGKIFLLDDDELIVSMLQRAAGDGYEVHAATDPEARWTRSDRFPRT
jgi:ActR/RegA family two-component response regulator